MVELIVTLIAALVFLTLLFNVLPHHRHHWVSRVGRGAKRAASKVHHHEPEPPDPFVALRIQSRLGVLASEIRAVEADPFAYAKMRRLEALRAAYDDLLDEGCRLAGVEAFDGEDRTARRWREEQELAERGWSW
jgi:hypothetical protein